MQGLRNSGLALLLSGLLGACQQQDEPPQVQIEVHPGEAVYKANCKVCHAQGINGAPIAGNTAMWSKRLGSTEQQLVDHATEGFGLMPANLGRNDLDREQIALAVSYMLSLL